MATLLALLPELGQLDGKAVASLTGTAPFARDSGLMQRQADGLGRAAAGAHRPLHGELTATRFNPAIRAFYQRLLRPANRSLRSPPPCASSSSSSTPSCAPTPLAGRGYRSMTSGNTVAGTVNP